MTEYQPPVRKNNTIGYHASRHSIPIGTYSHRQSVFAREADGHLEIHDDMDVPLARRRQLSMEKRLRYAIFPIFDKPLQLDTYDFAKRQGVAKRQIIELASNFLWIEKAYNVLFFRGSGLGKSFLAFYMGTR